jgi:hypothetical protein
MTHLLVFSMEKQIKIESCFYDNCVDWSFYGWINRFLKLCCVPFSGAKIMLFLYEFNWKENLCILSDSDRLECILRKIADWNLIERQNSFESVSLSMGHFWKFKHGNTNWHSNQRDLKIKMELGLSLVSQSTIFNYLRNGTRKNSFYEFVFDIRSVMMFEKPPISQ